MFANNVLGTKTSAYCIMELRLLVETPRARESALPFIVIEGKQWSLTEPIDSRSDQFPRYTCISYVWGTGRAANPIHPIYPMSDRTLPEGHTGEHGLHLRPRDGCRRGALGKSFTALEQVCAWNVKQTPQPDGTCLGDLETDTWIRSAWAYQEVVNSSRLWFAGEDIRRNLLQGQFVLDQLGHYLLKYGQSTQATSAKLRGRYPHLDALEELLLDWRTADYVERPALQVMSGISRHNINWSDYKSAFYSMIGAITQEPSSRTSNPTLESLSEAFMSLCERKGDFSFIFSSADRDDRAGYRWRPQCDILPSILPWHCFGEQSARRDAQGIWLQNIVTVTVSPTIGSAGRAVVSRWLQNSDLETALEGEIIRQASSTLVEMGFSGSNDVIVTSDGLLYPQRPLPAELPFRIGVARSLRWSGDVASPALVFVAEADHTKYIPGVFIGVMPSGASEVLLET
ncbi:hypothetical protein B0H21DRAFT_867427 [Amylocystis lapponica]|nr:hypothetical protein B0H21DRAFT_867427 [Amylocystis lapponica]